jgi:crotonobetainyl-CoA:carnitine CoA-transferase CaiB-like acyl-CoA transferase
MNRPPEGAARTAGTASGPGVAPTHDILGGVRVLEWTAYVNGTGAGYMLGDLGADVVKIEDPQHGDPYRGVERIWGLSSALPGGRNVGIELANRNKRSLAVDLKHPSGRALVHELVAHADVFFTNYFRNDVLKRVELDYETLHEINPRLVYALTTGWGTKSSEANDRAFGQAVEARLGAMWLTGDQEHDEPFMIHTASADTMGATLVALGVMAALYDRERTGKGQMVETSLVGAQMHGMGHPLNIALFAGQGYKRHSRRTHTAPFNNFYRCGDGNWIFIAEPEADRFWPQFCDVFGLDREDLRYSTLKERTKHAAELVAALGRVFSTRSSAEWQQLFADRGIGFCWAPINTIDQAKNDRVLIENGYLPFLDHPTLGRVRTIGLPLQFTESRTEPRRAAPDIGEGGAEAVSDWLGWDADRILELQIAGALL